MAFSLSKHKNFLLGKLNHNLIISYDGTGVIMYSA